MTIKKMVWYDEGVENEGKGVPEGKIGEMRVRMLYFQGGAELTDELKAALRTGDIEEAIALWIEISLRVLCVMDDKELLDQLFESFKQTMETQKRVLDEIGENPFP